MNGIMKRLESDTQWDAISMLAERGGASHTSYYVQEQSE